MLRRIFGPKRDEGTGGWRKFHNEEVHNFYSSPLGYYDDQIKQDDMDGACSTQGKMRNANEILIGTPGGKRPLEDRSQMGG
jgi:hypothetical protein